MNRIEYKKQITDDVFKWRTNGGEFIPVSRMKTSHLINVAKMIWNHVAPEELKLSKNYQKYVFTPYYTEEYLFRAFIAIMNELKTRSGDPAFEFRCKMTFVVSEIKKQQAIGAVSDGSI